MIVLPSKSSARQRAGPDAGGDHDRLGGDRLVADLDLVGRDDLGGAELRAHLVFSEQALDALVQLPGDVAAALDHLGEIPGRLAAVAEVRAVVLDQLDQVGVGQERLGRDAAPVQADAAELVALDAEDPLLELGGADRAGVAGRPAADHDDVVVVGHWFLILGGLEGESSVTTSMEAGSSSRPLRVWRKLGGHGSVDGAVVGGQGDGHDGADLDAVTFDDRPLDGGADGEDADLGQIEDRVELLGAEHAQVRDRERAAGQLFGRQRVGPSRRGEGLALYADLAQAQAYRHDEAPARSGRRRVRRRCRG